MGRELKRKEAKKNKNKIVEEKQEELNTEIKGITVLKVVCSTLLILLVLYYILAVFITKEIDISDKNDTTENTSETSSSVSNQIVAANLFNQKEEVYYVYCYDFNNDESGVTDIVNNASDKKIYRLDTSSGLNKKYVTEEEGNSSATGLNDLKIKNPTLIEVSGDRITGYYEGKNKIISFLSE